MAYKRRTTRRKYTARRKYGAKRRSAPRRRLGGYTTSLDPSGFGGSALSGAAIAAGGTILNKLMGKGGLTQTKNKQQYGQILRVSENASLSSTRYGYPMSRIAKMLYRKTAGRRTFYNNGSGSILTQTGKQTVQFSNTLAQLDLAAVKTALEPTAGANNVKIFFGYVKQKHTFKNQSNHVAVLTMYDLSTKRYAQTSSFDSPTELWDKGIIDAGGANDTRSIPNATPFQSPEFRRYFRTHKVTKIYLEPGETHEHTVYRRINRVANSTEWDLNTLAYIPGMTTTLMWAVYGSIGHEATVGDANPTNVTYMPCRIDYIVANEYNCVVVPGSANSYATIQNLSTTAPANWDFMAENDDVDGDLINS